MPEHVAAAPAEVAEAARPAPLARPGAAGGASALRPLTPATLAALQRAAGNRAVAATVLARKPAATKVRTLRPGLQGNDVTALQSMFNQLDEVIETCAPDGIFGPKTAKALKQFKLAHGDPKPDATADEATVAAVRAATKEPQDAKAMARKSFELGERAYQRKQYGQAFDAWEKTSGYTDAAEMDFNKGQALRRLGGRADEAAAFFEKYAKTGGRRADEASKLAAELRGPARTGDPESDKPAAAAALAKADKLYQQGDYAHAYDQFTIGGRIYPDPAFVWNRAQCLRRLGGRRQEAIALYEEYIASGHGQRTEDARKYVAALRGPVKTGDAAKDLESARTHQAKAEKLYGEGRYLEAADEFENVGMVHSGPESLWNRAQALRKAGGRRDDVVALYKQFIAAGGAGRKQEAEDFVALMESLGAGA